MLVNRARFHFGKMYGEKNLKVGPYILYQVGDFSTNPGYSESEHIQSECEICYIVSGEGRIRINGAEYPAQKGTLFLIRENARHEVLSEQSNPFRIYYLHFGFADDLGENKALLELKAFFKQDGGCMMENVINIQDPFSKLFAELLSHDFLVDKMIESYVQQILGTVCRVFSQKKFRTYYMESSEDVDRKLVYDIVNYIDTEIENIKGLAKISSEFGYSYTHIAKKISEILGESLKSYYTRRRFEKAEEMLLNDTSVTEIAETLGYKSIHAFSRAFKAWEGMNPSEFKKQKRTAKRPPKG